MEVQRYFSLDYGTKVPRKKFLQKDQESEPDEVRISGGKLKFFNNLSGAKS